MQSVRLPFLCSGKKRYLNVLAANAHTFFFLERIERKELGAVVSKQEKKNNRLTAYSYPKSFLLFFGSKPIKKNHRKHKKNFSLS